MIWPLTYFRASHSIKCIDYLKAITCFVTSQIFINSHQNVLLLAFSWIVVDVFGLCTMLLGSNWATVTFSAAPLAMPLKRLYCS